MKKKYLGDSIIVLIIILSSTLAYIIPNFKKADNTLISIWYNGKEVRTLSLFEDTQYSPNNGKTIIAVKNNSAFVEFSDCKNQNCVHMGKISEKGGFIACIPNKILIFAKSNAIDAVAG